MKTNKPRKFKGYADLIGLLVRAEVYRVLYDEGLMINRRTIERMKRYLSDGKKLPFLDRRLSVPMPPSYEKVTELQREIQAGLKGRLIP